MNRDMMARLGEMQEKLQKAQEEIENKVAEGTAGGGAVKVEISGGFRVKSVKIEPDVIDPDDLGMLEDLIIAATNEALEQVQAFQSENLGALTGGLGLPGGLPGLPGLGGAAGPGGGGQTPGNRAARRANRR
jgi:DNA-binding YbaB/EbfC family protein